MRLKRLLSTLIVVLFLFSACDYTSPFENNYKPKPTPPDTTQGVNTAPVDTAGVLKDSTDIAIGLGANSDSLLSSTIYAATVKREFDDITPQNQMKQAAIVQNDGSLNYSRPDQIIQAAQTMGLDVHGHTLVWHNGNNGTYLRSLLNQGDGGGGSSTNLAKNGGFESFTDSTPDSWTVVNSNNGSFGKATASANVHGGSSALKVTVDESSDNYQTQIQSASFATNSGDDYKVTFWIKASTSGCVYQLEGRSSSTSYSGENDTPMSYTQESYTFTADGSSSSITFDMGASPASKTYIDDVMIVDASANSGGGQGSATTDSAAIAGFMKKYIMQTVSHFQGQVQEWDVVNEPINSSGGLRTNPDPDTPTTGGTFYWDEFIGDQYISMALRYARQADPNIDLYVNEYNLSSNAQKLNGFLSLIDQLQSNDVPLDGIGTQMHININTSQSGIDNMFQKLAATGLKVRISELDVRVNPNSSSDYELTMDDLIQQQRIYNYAVYSYMQNVPQSQRSGITVWNLIDNGSFIVNANTIDYPTIFDKNYQKKPAYSGVMEGLMNIQPNY